MTKQTRGMDELRHHYEVEKELADQLRAASADARRKMYGRLYDELYRRVEDHPLLLRKSIPLEKVGISRAISTQLSFLSKYVTNETSFLEVGAGSCLVSIEVAKRVKHVYAIDVSAEMTNRSGFPANLELLLFDGCTIPSEVTNVDVAYSHQVMEHVHPDDALEQLRSIYDCLKVGGSYVCIVPNRLNGPHDISRYFDEVATGFHMKEYTTGELRRIFKTIGFSETTSYVGARGYYIRVPQFLLMSFESVFQAVPYKLRHVLGRTWFVRGLLEIRMVGRK